jgi:predicted  nucleic acid-binding Zn-ribbon protein
MRIENSRAPPSSYNFGRPSLESERTSFDSLKGPNTPIDGKPAGDVRFSSVRSILKPNNTPGTGQSVRFFSRDAYRVISPTQSSASEFEDPSLLERTRRSSPSRPSLQSVFPSSSAHDEPSTFDVPTAIQPIPPPDLGNIFDFTSEELPSIPPGYAVPLHDSAIEISDGDDKSLSLDAVDGKQGSQESSSQGLGDASPTLKLTVKTDRSNSFSFGQTLLQSLAESSPAAKSSPSSNRHRALSDTNIFTSVLPSATAVSDINNSHNSVVPYQPPERDPFAANAMTYYTPGTMLPPSPPRSTHTRAASREEDLIWSLRTQLALRQELCAQYEIDLAARDETVELLNARLGEADKELDRRKNAIRAWRKRVTELEKCVGRLEDEVDRSREESMDRSVMDEASGEALRMLHRRIGELERENKEKHSQEEKLREEVAARTKELEKVTREVQKQETDREPIGGEEQHVGTAATWEQERAELLSTNDALQHEQEQLRSQLATVMKDLAQKEKEYSVLQSELEAQWKHTEQHSEELARLKHEKEELAHEVESLREKLSQAQNERKDEEYTMHDLESELQEAWAMKDDLGIERDQVCLYASFLLPMLTR